MSALWSKSLVPCCAGLQPQTSRANSPQTCTGSYTLLPLCDVSSFQLVYAGHYKTGTNPQEAAIGNSVAVKAAVEIAGRIYTVNFSGSRIGTLPSGDFLVSDLVGTPLVAGQPIQVHTYPDPGVGGYFPYLQHVGEGYGGTDGWTDNTDVCDTPGITNGGQSPKNRMTCFAVIGTPTISMPSVAVIGDSIPHNESTAWSRANTTSAYGGYLANDGGGWACRTLRQLGIPYVLLSFGGERALDFNATDSPRRLRVAQSCTHWMIQYGTNDIALGATTAQTIARLTAIANLCLAAGSTPILATIPPRTTSTDYWGTLANQTVAATESTRLAVNTWIRSRAVADCIDICAAIETGGKFAVLPVLDTATASAGGANTISVSPARWSSNQWVSATLIEITGGTGAGQIRLVASNTTSQITTTANWATNPDNTSTFAIRPQPTLNDGVHLDWGSCNAIAQHFRQTKTLRQLQTAMVMQAAGGDIDPGDVANPGPHGTGALAGGTLDIAADNPPTSPNFDPARVF